LYKNATRNNLVKYHGVGWASVYDWLGESANDCIEQCKQ